MKRGGLVPERATRINQAVQDLVLDLHGYDDLDPAPDSVEPPLAGKQHDDRQVPKTPPLIDNAPSSTELPSAWQGHSPVLCLPGRGRLDAAAATMLAQLLEKHSVAARVVTHQSASKEAIDALDTRGTAMICVTYLNLGGNPLRVRALLLCLRQRMPNVAILVSLWPEAKDTTEEADVLEAGSEEDLRNRIGADLYASSLAGAVAECVRFAHEQKALGEGDHQSP